MEISKNMLRKSSFEVIRDRYSDIYSSISRMKLFLRNDNFEGIIAILDDVEHNVREAREAADNYLKLFQRKEPGGPKGKWERVTARKAKCSLCGVTQKVHVWGGEIASDECSNCGSPMEIVYKDAEEGK